jgi:hypothetical protein
MQFQMEVSIESNGMSTFLRYYLSSKPVFLLVQQLHYSYKYTYYQLIRITSKKMLVKKNSSRKMT